MKTDLHRIVDAIDFARLRKQADAVAAVVSKSLSITDPNFILLDSVVDLLDSMGDAHDDDKEGI